ncbi:MAG: hypothetical protein ABI373_08575 [Flavobacteriales bacterium]
MTAPTKRAWTCAHIALIVQFLALIRCLVEYFRLKHDQGASFDTAGAELFIEGALITSVLCAAAVFAYVRGRPWWVVALAILTVAALLLLKVLHPAW